MNYLQQNLDTQISSVHSEPFRCDGIFRNVNNGDIFPSPQPNSHSGKAWQIGFHAVRPISISTAQKINRCKTFQVNKEGGIEASHTF